MKNHTIFNLRFLLTAVICFFVGCKKTEQNSNNEQQYNTSAEQKFIPKYGKPYFDYDEIDHYHASMEEDSVMALDTIPNRSKEDQLKLDIIINKIPKNINDTEFIKSLEKIGFEKSIIKPHNFKKINEIFIEKTVNEILEYACVAVYRDILVFKKKEKIVGIAKICFDCHQKQIVGTKAITENFGQDGDYEKLQQILYTNQYQ